MPLSQQLHQQIDRCVMCGTCSQHCPTYALKANENESPRGRLALIAALNQGQLKPDETLRTHLDHCLGCRACERSCPSQVAFGEIMDQARALLEPQRPAAERRRRRAIQALFAHPRTLRLTLAGLRWLQKSGLGKALRQLPAIPSGTRWRPYYPPLRATEGRGDVALFLGCINETLGQDELRATVTLLTAAGYGVYIPARQTCCGALHRHAGNPAAATRLARQNLHAFDPGTMPALQAILHTASGCTAQLTEYAALLDAQGATTDSEEPAGAEAFARRVQDINHFLAAIEWPEYVSFTPLQRRVAVHSPCSLKQVLRRADAPFQLLRRIPGLDICALPDNGHCCGGAGGYMLEQPEYAARLRTDKLQALQHSRADLLVTSNIGCALHLRSGLLHDDAPKRDSKKRKNGTETADGSLEILHPVTLLARQLRIRD